MMSLSQRNVSHCNGNALNADLTGEEDYQITRLDRTGRVLETTGHSAWPGSNAMISDM